MKKLLLILCALLLCAGLSAAADEETVVDASGMFKYAVREDGSAELITYLGPDGRVLIPNELDGHPLTAVRKNPFYDEGGAALKPCAAAVAKDHPYLATINNVLFGKTDWKLIAYPTTLTDTEYQIPEGIEIIGDYAFRQCGNLRSVSIPDSVTTIGASAFAYCINLSSAEIPAGVTSIGESAFYDCNQLTSVVLPKGIGTIPAYAFGGCDNYHNWVLRVHLLWKARISRPPRQRHPDR